VQAQLFGHGVADLRLRRQRDRDGRLEQLFQVLPVALLGVAAVRAQDLQDGAVVQSEDEDAAAGAEIELDDLQQAHRHAAVAAVQVIDEDDQPGAVVQVGAAGPGLEQFGDRVLEEQVEALAVAGGGESVVVRPGAPGLAQFPQGTGDDLPGLTELEAEGHVHHPFQQGADGESGTAVEVRELILQLEPGGELGADLADQWDQWVGLVLVLPRGIPDAQRAGGRVPDRRVPTQGSAAVGMAVDPGLPALGAHLQPGVLGEHQGLLNGPPAQGDEGAAHDAGLA